MTTLLYMPTAENISVFNINGQDIQIERAFLEKVLIFGWIFQLLAIAINLGGYLIHPMAVEKSVSSKLFVHVFGTRYAWNGENICVGYNHNYL